MSEQIASIFVEYSEAALFGSDDPEELGIDAEASSRRYGESLANYLEVEYPDSNQITTKPGLNDRIVVNGNPSHDEAPRILQIMEIAWNGDDWQEEKIMK